MRNATHEQLTHDHEGGPTINNIRTIHNVKQRDARNDPPEPAYLDDARALDNRSAGHFASCTSHYCRYCHDLAADYLDLISRTVYNGDNLPPVVDD